MPCPARRGQANELRSKVEVKLPGLSTATTPRLQLKTEINQSEGIAGGEARLLTARASREKMLGSRRRLGSAGRSPSAHFWKTCATRHGRFEDAALRTNLLAVSVLRA